jgi:hypothetical protein
MVTPFEASAAPTAKEAKLAAMINRARSARGLPPLAVRDDLVRMAHRHSTKMARRRYLFHHGCLSCRFPSGSWSALAENVGTGGSLRGVHRLMMRSAGHRTNVLGGFNAVGIGVVRKGGRFEAAVPGTAASSSPPAQVYRRDIVVSEIPIRANPMTRMIRGTTLAPVNASSPTCAPATLAPALSA